jgi:nitroreductase
MSELTVSNAAHARRAIRKYTDQPVPQALLEQVFETVRLAPSAWNIQPWRFIVVTDPEKKHALMKAAYSQPQVGDAKAVIVVASDMKDAFENADEFLYPQPSEEAKQKAKESILGAFAQMSEAEKNAWGRNQTNIALGYLLLSLAAHGLASSPMLGFVPEQVRALYGLGEQVEIAALVAVGYADEPGKPHHRHSVSRLTTWL